MKTRLLTTFAMFALALIVVVSPAMAYTFPSTNDANREAGLPHVNFVSNGPGVVTLEFVNTHPSVSFFEYRIDGVIPTGASPHPIVTGDVIYPGVGLSTVTSVQRTFNAGSTVEVRRALGGERDWDFDWVTFEVLPVGPASPDSKEDCMNGGWEAFGFSNQGQCIRYVNTGVDSREP